MKIAKISDPYFDSQWNLKLMNVRKAWEITKGKGVVVGIIDSGVDGSHMDLGWAKDIYLTTTDSRAATMQKYRPVMFAIMNEEHPKILRGWNFVDNNPHTYDWYRHGTYLAGAIAAEEDSFGMVGVAPECKIRPYVVIDEKGRLPDKQYVADAIRRAATDGCDVINLSLAWNGYNKAIDLAIKDVTQTGVVIVAATGNNNRERALFPANVPEAIAVGGCNAIGGRWVHNTLRGSNYGLGLDCVAPGAAQITTWYMRSRFANIDGTSMAAANMSGICALMKSVDKRINTEMITDAIVSYGNDIWDKEIGWGVPDAYLLAQAYNESLEDELANMVLDMSKWFDVLANISLGGVEQFSKLQEVIKKVMI